MTAATVPREDYREVAEPRGKVRHWAEASETPPAGLSRIGRALCRVIVLHRAEDIPGAAARPMCRRCETIHYQATTTLFEVWGDRATVAQALADLLNAATLDGFEVVEEDTIRKVRSGVSFYGRVRLRKTDGAS